MIRRYKAKDKNQLMEILRCNIPKYFDASEERDFSDYLDHRIEDYFVVEINGRIIGSGGINYFPEDKIARISWDMVHPNFQGKGIGKELTEYRIAHIRKDAAIHLIVVRTSQLAYKFYLKLGFDVDKIERDFWAQGFDLYQMEMKTV